MSGNNWAVLVRFLFAIIVLIASRTVSAQSSRDTALSEAAMRARVVNIQSILDERAGRAQFWQYGWMGLGYAVSGGFAVHALTTNDEAQRLTFAFAAGGAFVDATVHAVGSIQVQAASRVRSKPDATAEDLRVKLAVAEAELEAAAEAEYERGTLLKAQILPLGFALANGLVLGIAFGEVRGAIINTLVATLVNELRVLSQPTSTIDALKRYRLDPEAAHARTESRGLLTLSWSIDPTGGVTAYGTF